MATQPKMPSNVSDLTWKQQLALAKEFKDFSREMVHSRIQLLVAAADSPEFIAEYGEDKAIGILDSHLDDTCLLFSHAKNMIEFITNDEWRSDTPLAHLKRTAEERKEAYDRMGSDKKKAERDAEAARAAGSTSTPQQETAGPAELKKMVREARQRVVQAEKRVASVEREKAKLSEEKAKIAEKAKAAEHAAEQHLTEKERLADVIAKMLAANPSDARLRKIANSDKGLVPLIVAAERRLKKLVAVREHDRSLPNRGKRELVEV